MGGHVACMGERIGGYRVLVGKPEGKSTLDRPRYSWEDNIKMYLEVGWRGIEWIDLAEDRTDGGSCKRGNETSVSIKCREFID